jgi:hypothetical protein
VKKLIHNLHGKTIEFSGRNNGVGVVFLWQKMKDISLPNALLKSSHFSTAQK